MSISVKELSRSDIPPFDADLDGKFPLVWVNDSGLTAFVDSDDEDVPLCFRVDERHFWCDPDRLRELRDVINEVLTAINPEEVKSVQTQDDSHQTVFVKQTIYQTFSFKAPVG